jgi:hypothetical protein
MHSYEIPTHTILICDSIYITLLARRRVYIPNTWCVGVEATLTTYIQEVSSLNLGQDTILTEVFIVFISPSRQMLGL